MSGRHWADDGQEHDCAHCESHAPVVPASGGIEPMCSCDWTPHSGFTVADHLRDMQQEG